MAPNDADRQKGDENAIVLGILQAIDSGERVTQRAVASELGIALGLVNAYVKRCMRKGLIKIRTAPARRYAYYLTPKGFSEKSRLTASYLAHSFSFFRKARGDCERVLAEATEWHMRRVALVGSGDLAEIILLCAVGQPLHIIAIVDRAGNARSNGVPVVDSLDALEPVDGLIVTDLVDPNASYAAAVAVVGEDRVLAPALLRVGRSQRSRSSASLRKLAS